MAFIWNLLNQFIDEFPVFALITGGLIGVTVAVFVYKFFWKILDMFS